MRCTVALLAAVLMSSAGPAVAFAQDVLIDRVLATVGGRVITLSAVRGARALGLVKPPPGADPVQSERNALIERALILEEVERYAPPEPDPKAIDQRLAAIRAAQGPSFEQTLLRTGFDLAAVRQWVRNDLRIERYLAQRFAGAAEPTSDDIESYRRQHAASGSAPLDEAAVRAAVAEERRAALVREWIDGLRSRASITITPEPR